uniref:SUN domain-containing protein n=1 Tax=Angiostrongylus cantonensis TaxID=6313 RepID=A0A0K0DPP0_ANGCA
MFIFRRHRWVWWLLPFFLLFLFFRYGTNHGVTILGRDVSELQEKVNKYAQSFVDPDAVYAKSLNSIYDEYWRSGKLYRHSIIWRITTAASNSYFFLVNVFRSIFGFLYASVRGLLSFILDFFAVCGREAYSLLPTVSLLSFPNLSEALSTTQMLQYFTNATGLASWKSCGVFTSTEQHYYKIFTLFSNIGTMLLTGLSDLFFMLSNAVYAMFILIENSFHRTLVAVVDQQQTYLEPKPNVHLINSDVNPNVCVPLLAPAIDEAKLVDKISAVVRAQMDQDFKTKVEKELKALSAIYDEKFSKLELDKKQVDIDYSRLESIIRSAILEYDSDKTGMFDFALESAVSLHPLRQFQCSPFQRNSKTLFPGECWSFKGPVGYITIGLSHAINVTLISYEHIGAHQAPGGQRPSAPKTFKIWAYKSENDMATRVLLGDFMYDLKASPLQFFVVKTQPDYPVKIIEMEVTSNYGAEYTSLYRLRVHGSLYKSGDM